MLLTAWSLLLRVLLLRTRGEVRVHLRLVAMHNAKHRSTEEFPDSILCGCHHAAAPSAPVLKVEAFGADLHGPTGFERYKRIILYAEVVVWQVPCPGGKCWSDVASFDFQTTVAAGVCACTFAFADTHCLTCFEQSWRCSQSRVLRTAVGPSRHVLSTHAWCAPASTRHK